MEHHWVGRLDDDGIWVGWFCQWCRATFNGGTYDRPSKQGDQKCKL